MPEQELSLESQLHLKFLEQEIAKLSLEDLRISFVELATQKAKQEQMYKIFLSQALVGEKNCNLQLNKVEKECDACRRRITEMEF